MAQDIHYYSKREEAGHSEEILDQYWTEIQQGKHQIPPCLIPKGLDGTVPPAFLPVAYMSWAGSAVGR